MLINYTVIILLSDKLQLIQWRVTIDKFAYGMTRDSSMQPINCHLCIIMTIYLMTKLLQAIKWKEESIITAFLSF